MADRLWYIPLSLRAGWIPLQSCGRRDRVDLRDRLRRFVPRLGGVTRKRPRLREIRGTRHHRNALWGFLVARVYELAESDERGTESFRHQPHNPDAGRISGHRREADREEIGGTLFTFPQFLAEYRSLRGRILNRPWALGNRRCRSRSPSFRDTNAPRWL